MNILLLLKEIPIVEGIHINSGDELVLNEEIKWKLNIFDRYILEEALHLKNKFTSGNIETNIFCISLGKDNSRNALIEGLSIVCDKAFLVCDDIFNNLDSIGKAKIISKAIEVIEQKYGKIDLIISGQQSTDTQSCSMGSMISEILSTNYESGIIEIKIDNNYAILKKRTGERVIDVKTNLPLMVSFTKPNYDYTIPLFKRLRWANNEEIQIIDYNYLKGYGLDKKDFESKTEIITVKKPGRKTGNKIIDVNKIDGVSKEEINDKCVSLLMNMLLEDKII